MYFTIVTNKEVAEQIIKQCSFDAKQQPGRSYELGDVNHQDGFSEVQIKAKDGFKIKPEDIFWLGRFSATQ